jgi:hypothetical protein
LSSTKTNHKKTGPAKNENKKLVSNMQLKIQDLYLFQYLYPHPDFSSAMVYSFNKKKLLLTTKFNIWHENNILAFKLHENYWSPVHHKYLKIYINIPRKSTLQPFMIGLSSLFYNFFFHTKVVEWLLSKKHILILYFLVLTGPEITLANFRVQSDQTFTD